MHLCRPFGQTLWVEGLQHLAFVRADGQLTQRSDRHSMGRKGIPVISQTIAHYLVQEQIGAGGMGEVYRAYDTRLGRNVALKVLPEVFARDTERMARFEREAKVLASLNHPNIASIYGRGGFSLRRF
jgi:serine/threonine protein kinase